MAGSGPAPAPKTRRRNKEKFEELPAEGHQGEFPPLPRTYRLERVVTEVDSEGNKVPTLKVVNVAFLKATRDWYEEWARSPMATEFTGVHWQRLKRIAPLIDAHERAPSKDLLAEIRLQEAGFGGTPLDLRRLGRTIAQAPTGGTPARKQPKRSDRRRRLTVVQS